MVRLISVFLFLPMVLMTTLTPGPILTWKEGNKLSLPKGGYGSGVLNGRLLLAGGTHWKDDKKLWTDEVVAYDPRLDQWEALSPLPKALAYGATASVDKAFYFLGGAGPEKTERAGYRLTQQSNSYRWEEFTQLPLDRCYSRAVVIGANLYLVGGSEDVNDLSKASTSLLSLSLSKRKATWKTLRSTPGEGRAVFAAAACGNELYVFGGCLVDAGNVRNLASAYRYDPKKDQWIRLHDAPVATRAWSASAADDRYIFLFGGYSSQAGFSSDGQFEKTVYRYDTKLDSYQEMSPLPFANADMTFHFFNGAFYGAGGEPLQKARAAWTFIGRLGSP